MNQGKVINVDRFKRSFSVLIKDKVKEFIHQNYNNVIIGTDIVFRNLDFIFTFIIELEGKVLKDIIESFCKLHEYNNGDHLSILNIILTISKPFTNDEKLDKTLMMCIHFLNPLNDLRGFLPKKSYKIVENNLIKFIFENISKRFCRLLGLRKRLNYKKFYKFYQGLIDPLNNIKNIDNEMYDKLSNIFNYGDEKSEIIKRKSVRKTLDYIKKQKYTCIPVKELLFDTCFNNVEEQIKYHLKYGFVEFSNHLIEKNQFDKQKYIKKYINDHDFKIIHGEAGTGKTTQIANIISNKRSIILAPTGKAIQKVKEKTSAEFMGTIHKFIHSSKIYGGFFNYLVIDEMSMVPLNLFYKLLIQFEERKIKIKKFILVGDPNQLEPIKRGEIFKWLIESIPSEKLTTNYRMLENSSIFINSNMIIKDEIDFITDDNFKLCKNNDIDKLFSDVGSLIEKLKETDNLTDFFFNFKILTPYNEYVKLINNEIKRLIFNSETRFNINELVMCTKNLYDFDSKNDVMNGEEGLIKDINDDNVLVNFGNGKELWFYLNENSVRPMMYLKTSYAITIHSSQGSEWNNLIVFIPNKSFNFNFITKNMVYTALTRTSNFVQVYCDLLEIYAKKQSEERYSIFNQISNGNPGE